MQPLGDDNNIIRSNESIFLESEGIFNTMIENKDMENEHTAKIINKQNSTIFIMICVLVILFNIPFTDDSLLALLPSIPIPNQIINQNRTNNNYRSNQTVDQNHTNDHLLFPEWIEEYNNFTSSSNNATKYLIYQCYRHCGGVGDRMNGIISLYYVALITKRTFIIDSPYPYPLINMLIPNKVKWNQTSDVYKSSKSNT